MIPIYKPYLTSASLKYAHAAIDSTWISSTGKYIDMATERLRDILGVKYVQLVNNGTSATHLVAKSLILKNPELQRVIVPNNVYVAAWNAFLYENVCLSPVDADLDTWNVDASLLPDSLPFGTGILLVHNVGNIIDVNPLIDKYGLNAIVEDNCEGFMGKYGEAYSGTKSLASSVSFFGNKTITSGEGGAFVTNDEEIFEFIKTTRGQGQTLTNRYIHDRIGYNYRMTNIQAAILLGQLDMLPEILEKKQEIFCYYRDRFSRMEKIRVQKQDPATVHSNWMMAIRILGNGSYSQVRDYLKVRGVESRPMFYPMSSHSYLKDTADSDNEVNAAILSRECMMLPSYPSLEKKDIKYIADTIEEYVHNEI